MATSSDYENSEANNVAREHDDFTTSDRSISTAVQLPIGYPHPAEERPNANAIGLDLLADARDGRRSLDAFRTAEAAALTGGEMATAATAKGAQDPVKSDSQQNFLTKKTVAPAYSPSTNLHTGTAAIAPPFVESNSESGFSTLEPDATAMQTSGGMEQLANSRHEGTINNDTLDGSNDSQPPFFGHNIYDGLAGHDFIRGSNYGDELLGNEGNDTLVGGKGNDTFDGGNGFDYISYAQEKGTGNGTGFWQGAVFVNFTPWSQQVVMTGGDPYSLASNGAVDTWGHIDTLDGVEGVLGTSFGDNIYASGNGSRTFAFFGGGGDDIITGGEYVLEGDTLDGGNGADSIYGGEGGDRIYASQGAASDGTIDQLYGDNGNDTLEGSAEDYLTGGNGSNTLIGGHILYDFTTPVTVNLSTSRAYHASGVDILQGVFWAQTGNGADTFIAGTTGAYFNGGGGDDNFWGGSGNDTLVGGSGYDVFHATAGNDVIDAGENRGSLDYTGLNNSVEVNLVAGTAVKLGNGTDTFYSIKDVDGSNFDDHIIGANIDGGSYINGRWGNDTIEGLELNDQLHGDAGNDSIIGGMGDDKLYGSTGNDTLDGGIGADTMEGGTEDDVYYINNVGDVVKEDLAENGIDTVHTTISYSLGSFIEHAIVGGSAGVTITGNDSVNHLTSGDGSDTLDGGDGADVLVGGNGNDRLNGGVGADIMTGGNGDDIFYIDNLGDFATELNGTGGGTDTAYVSVKNFDGRKLANIENIVLVGPDASINFPPDAPVVKGALLPINENFGGPVCTVVSTNLDGNGGALEYYLVNDFGGKFAIDKTTGKIALQAAVNYETDPNLIVIDAGKSTEKKYFNLQVYAVETEVGGLQSPNGTVQVFITNINEKPTGITYSPTQIVEGGPEGQQIASVLSVSDPDTPPAFRDFRYALVGAPDNILDGKGMFAVDSLTGTIKVGTARLPNIETPTEYTIQVRVMDSGDSSLFHVQTVKITVNPLANTRPDAPVVQGVMSAVAENQTDKFATVRSTDDGNGGDISYQLVDDFNGQVTIDSATGEIRLAAGVSYESATGVITTGSGTAGETKYFPIKVYALESISGLRSLATNLSAYITNVNEAPTGVTFGTVNTTLRAGTTGAGVNVVLATAVDPDSTWSGFATNKFMFSNGLQVSGHFRIHADTGQITTDVPLTAADAGLVTLQVVAYDPNTPGSSTVPVTFTVSADTAPTNVRLTTGGAAVTVAENSTVVGTVTADDNGGAAGLRYSIASNANFDIDATTGQIFVKGTANLSYEGGTQTYSVDVTATDANGTGLSSAPRTITITLSDVNEAAADLAFTGQQTIKAGVTGAGENVALATASDPDILNTAFTNNLYRFANGTQIDGKFTIHATTGQITTNDAITAADVGSKTLSVEAYDEGNGALVYTESHTFTIADPLNMNPTITGIVNGVTTPDNELASLFAGINIIDDGILSVWVAWTGGAGNLANIPLSTDFPNAIIGSYAPGDTQFFIEGSAQDVSLILQALKFDPEDRPNDPVGTAVDTDFTVTVTDSGGLTAQVPVVVTSTTANRMPTNIMLNAGPLFEDTGVGVSIGDLTATDENGGDTITFDFANDPNANPGNLFRIDIINGGPVLVVNGLLDYETAPHGDGIPNGNRWYEVLITASDGALTSPPELVKVFVTDVNPDNRAPVIEEGQTDWTIEDTAIASPFSELTFTDQDGGDITVTIQLDIPSSGVLDNFLANGVTYGYDDLSGYYWVTGAADLVTDAVNALTFDPDDRANAPYHDPVVTHFEVTVFDARTFAISTVTVTSEAANRLPTNISLSANSINESNGQGTPVGVLGATDTNQGDTVFTFALTDDAGGHFRLDFDQVTGVYQLMVEAQLDYETAPHGDGVPNGVRWYEVKVTASDGHPNGTSNEQTLIVYVTDDPTDNNAPSAPTLTDGAIAETAALNDYVGELNASDIDSDVVTFTFADSGSATSHDGAFKIVLNTTSGKYEIRVASQDAIQVSQDTDIPYVIVASDGRGGTASASVVISIDHINKAPDTLTFDNGLTAVTVAENLRGEQLGILLGSDPDATDPASSLQYAISPENGDPSHRFEVVGGVLKLIDGVALDYDTLPDGAKFYTVKVRVTDTQGAHFDQIFTINVSNDPVDPPNNNPGSLTFTDTTTQADSVEGVLGATIGTLLGTDPDANDTGLLTYRLINDPSGKFEVVNGVLKVIATESLDVSTPQHTVTVRVWDGHGGYLDQNFVIDVTPEGTNTPPTNLTLSQLWVMELASTNDFVGQLSANDADPLTYWIVDSNGNEVANDGRFKIVNNQLQVADGLKLDYEHGFFHDVVIRARDGSSYTEQSFHIDVIDLIGESVFGNTSDNVIMANYGNDKFVGGDGDEIMSGGLGRDTLTGNGGNDAFVFDKNPTSANRDTVTDFHVGEDKIHLLGSIFRLNSLKGQALNDATFYNGADGTTFKATTRIIYEKTGTTAKLYYDRDGNLAGERVEIASFTTIKPDLTFSDFLVI
ncbi:cadherin domain-containing protein [Microvirga brassicacearum]|uniref:Cadherin domain-containing protein n=1 Tax=Microvirga brassicacearum TaxID=2580413 RepID=A0A5N3PCC5_9HYPH|nr:cadherin domain-containing protein [Microvirga brassicacearum]KAB0267379.1 hypothetical protein FEZ63_08685 [Microvirga brassicacearum]